MPELGAWGLLGAAIVGALTLLGGVVVACWLCRLLRLLDRHRK